MPWVATLGIVLSLARILDADTILPSTNPSFSFYILPFPTLSGCGRGGDTVVQVKTIVPWSRALAVEVARWGQI